MIKITDWVAAIPEEEKRLAYVGENQADTRQFLLTGEDAATYGSWGFHLDMAFDLSTVTKVSTHQSQTTQESQKETISETATSLTATTTRENRDVTDVTVDCANPTDVAALTKQTTPEGLVLTWTILRQHTMLPGKLRATLRAISAAGQVKKSAVMVFDVEAAVVAEPAAMVPLSEFEVMEQHIDALTDAATAAATTVEKLTPQAVAAAEDAQTAAKQAANAAGDAARSADAAEAAAEKAETKVESLIERNNKHPVSLWVGTKAEYAAIRDKDEGRLYLISDDNDLSGFANPHNLLDNSDFTNPVNQRGKTAYTEASGYTIDRWKKRGAPEESTVAVESGGIRIKRTSQNAYTGIFQIHKYRAAAFAGKTFTFAVKIKECGTRTGIRIIGSPNGTNNSYVADTIADKPGIYTVTATIPTTYAETYIGVAIIPGMTSSTGVDGAAGDVVVEWAALYEGIYAADNIPAYKPKGYAAELAECQRYYNKIVSAVLNGYITASARDLFVQIPCAQMIKAPTFSFSGAFTVRTITGYSNIAHETTPSTYKHVATNSVGVRVSLGWGETISELDANQGKYYDYGETLGVVANVNNTPASLHTGTIELSAEY